MDDPKATKDPQSTPGAGHEMSARLIDLARTLLANGGTLESTATGGQVDRLRIVRAMEEHIHRNALAFEAPSALTIKAAASEAVESAERAIARVAGGGSPSNLTDIEYASLEAIVQVTGRPAMRYSNGSVEMPASDLGENGRWRALIATSRSKINAVSGSVGRITLKRVGQAEIQGTGWRLGSDLVVTNRHVLQWLVENPDDPPSRWRIDHAKHPSVDFAPTDNASKPQQFAILEVVYYAPEDQVDFAVLRLTINSAPLPPPVEINFQPESAGRTVGPENARRFQGGQVYVVGHPYRAYSSSLSASVFGVADGSKRWAPGFVVSIQSADFTLDHDCSTLGGNSGSCVFTTSGHAAIGLHMGGVSVDQSSGQGSANRALAFFRLGTHRVAEILRAGTV